jgi:phosphoglycerol transferase
MRARHPDVGFALLAGGISSLLSAGVLRLWHASLGVPFAPGGDGYLVLMQVKGLLDHGWVLSNSSLGAPLGQDLHDYAANRELLHVVAIKVLGLFSSNPGAVVNVYFLLSFPLVAIAAFAVLRWLGISRWVAVAMAVLFALAPFHFRHQTFLYAYYAVPLAAYLVLAVLDGRMLFERRLSRRTLLTLGVCAVVALSSFYFAAFTVFLVAIAGLLALVASRRLSSLVAPAAIVVAIVGMGLLASAPDLIYKAQHGSNPDVARRGAEESLIYGTNITQLVMPVPDHRFPPLRHLHDRWATTTPVDGEPTHLGLVAAAGFVWLLALALALVLGASGKLARDRRHRQLAVTSLAALLVGTTGGVSALIAYLVSPQLRAWTRLSIFIAFFALAAVGLLLDAGYEWAKRRDLRVGRVRFPPAAFVAALAAICVIGVLDQTSQAVIPKYAANATTWNDDAAFAGQIEQRLGQGAMVLQLPYVSFPESKPVNGTGPYDPVRPYLHAGGLRWSFGAMKGRPANWQAEFADPPARALLPLVAAAGFDGIYVDRSGYTDGAQSLDADLRRETGADPLTSADGRFELFDLRAYRRDQAQRTPAAELDALADATLHPIRTDFPNVFSDPVQEGTALMRWSTTPDARITVTNPSSRARDESLSVKLARPGAAAAPVTLTYPDGSNETLQVTPEGVQLDRKLTFPSGDSAVAIHVDGPGVSSGYVKLIGWRITPS